jgi:D-alanine-D-alanine ligase
VKKKLRILALFDVGSPTALDEDLRAELETADWKVEKDVLDALKSLGHETDYLAIFDDLDLLRQKLDSYEPDLVFNLADQFRNNRALDQNIVSFLELRGCAFTGCGSTGLTLCKHKAISKKILGYHRIRVPEFTVVARGRRVSRPARLAFPLIVKPLKEEASYGIAQASFVESDEQLEERVQFIHASHESDAIVEQYVDGRELYVSILGSQRLTAFPMRELVFEDVPPDQPKIATFRAKWDAGYRKRWGLKNKSVGKLDPVLAKRIVDTCKRIYRLLTIDGYGRVDLRVTPEGEIYFIEANPNPHLASDEDFALSALAAGVSYPKLIERIVRTGLNTVRE